MHCPCPQSEVFTQSSAEEKEKAALQFIVSFIEYSKTKCERLSQNSTFVLTDISGVGFFTNTVAWVAVGCHISMARTLGKNICNAKHNYTQFDERLVHLQYNIPWSTMSTSEQLLKYHGLGSETVASFPLFKTRSTQWLHVMSRVK